MTSQADRSEQMRQLQRRLDGEDVRDAARALLDPGEQLRELAEVDVAYGDTGPIADAQPVEVKPSGRIGRLWAFATRTRLRAVLLSSLLLPLAVLEIGPSALLDRLIGGRVCQGPRGSAARGVQHALSVLGPDANHVVVTDRRLLWVRKELFTEPPRFHPVWSVPVMALATARRRPRGPLRRRVELCFTDGSRIVLALPAFRSPPPRKFLAALRPPVTSH